MCGWDNKFIPRPVAAFPRHLEVLPPPSVLGEARWVAHERDEEEEAAGGGGGRAGALSRIFFFNYSVLKNSDVNIKRTYVFHSLFDVVILHAIADKITSFSYKKSCVAI